MKFRFIVLFLLVAFLHLSAQISLPSVFNNDMVLQQQSNVALWGKAIPGKVMTVKTSWNNKVYTVAVAADSSWRVKVVTPKASYNSYTINFNCGVTKTINNILIGEVWLCGGQSNMEMPVKGFSNQPNEGSLNDIVTSENNYLRCFTMVHNSTIVKQSNCTGSWAIAGPNTTGDFSATAYYFGSMLQKVLGIPVGLLHCSWGGSTIEAWMSTDALAVFPDKKIPQSEAENNPKHQTPSTLFNGMLNSLIGYGIRGTIWYQGEANRSKPEEYPDLFSSMHKDWINKWDIGIFPIYFCQIAPFDYGDKVNSAFLRESQSLIAKTQINTAMAVLMDIGEEKCIHPSHKRVCGERLAYLALAKDYGFTKIQYQSPEYKSVDFKDGKAMVQFINAPSGLTTFGNEFSGFELAAADKKFYPARVKIIKNGLLEVSSDDVKEPLAVRYAFKNFFRGSLFGVNGLPVSSFRSDDWNQVK